ncbi:hypothetical protein [Klebsiella phage vB_KpnM_VAC13]|nr:hypothetical protein [Klebsiella phage vB_KpnM_VAC13]QYC51137.1 hypothetical protein [Klebsiella phage vB_KpnM-VAC66]WMX18231.1 hypothetical protein [Klebsiella phage KpF2]
MLKKPLALREAFWYLVFIETKQRKEYENG